jgi:hypothetical protein
MSKSTLNDALSPPEDMPAIHVLDWQAGSGKTRAVIKDIMSHVRDGYKIILTTPTIGVLQEASYDRLTNDRDGLGESLTPKQVVKINDDEAMVNDESVTRYLISRLSRDIEDHPKTGRVFMCSWEAYSRVTAELQRLGLHHLKVKLIIDEVPSVVEHVRYASNSMVPRVRAMLDMDDRHNVLINTKDKEKWLKLSREVKTGDDAFDSSEHLKKTARYLMDPNWLTTIVEESEGRLLFTFYLKPQVFACTNDVKLLGANLKQSLMYWIYTKCGIDFIDDVSLEADRRESVFPNGDKFTIAPLQEENLSTNQIRAPDKARWMMELAVEIIHDHFERDEPFIYCVNNGVRMPSPSHAKNTKVMLQGTNEYDDYCAAAFLCSMHPGAEFTLDLRVHWNITAAQYFHACQIETIYQYAMRLEARKGHAAIGEKYLVVVGDLRSAKQLRAKIKGSSISLAGMVQVNEGDPAVGMLGSGRWGALIADKRQLDRLNVYFRNAKSAKDDGMEMRELLSGTQDTNLKKLAEELNVPVGNLYAVLSGVSGSEVFPRSRPASYHGFKVVKGGYVAPVDSADEYDYAEYSNQTSEDDDF